MIELLIAAALVGVAGAAGALGAASVRRRARALASASGVREARWIDVGDAVILDRGRGEALSIARRTDLAAAGDAPFLTLLETDGPAAARALLAYDPQLEASLAVLQAAPIDGCEALAHAGARPPDAIEVVLDGRPRALRLARRCVARAGSRACEGAPLDAALPTSDEGAPLLIALYEGASDACALAVRGADGRVATFVGRRVARDAIDVLRNRAHGP